MTKTNVNDSKFSQLLLSPRMIFAILILLSMTAIALVGPSLSYYNSFSHDLSQRLCPMTLDHPLGCDLHGNDILAQLIQGTRTSLYISFITVFFTTIIGIIVGLLAGYFGGYIDKLFLYFTEILMAFPGILLLLALSSLLGATLNNLILVLILTGWPGPGRIVRAEILKAREYEYILAATSLGASSSRILFKHLLPNIWTPLVVSISFSLSGIILIESSLSFLGFGAQDTVSWGSLINQGRSLLTEAPHISLFPGIMLILLVLAFNTAGDALRDFLDPKNETLHWCFRSKRTFR